MRFIDRFFLSVVCFLSVTAICTSQLQPTIAGTSSTQSTQFNKGLVVPGITGNEIDTLPPVLTFSEECGTFLCRATELRDYGVDPNISAQVDQGIFDIFIRDSVNSNYKLELITSPKITPLPKITTFDFKLVVKDRTQDAKAVLVVIDRAGKFVEETFNYKAVPFPKISHSALTFRVFKADSTVTTSISISNPGMDTMYIDSMQLQYGSVFTITKGKILSRFALAPRNEHRFTVVYTSVKASIKDTTPDKDLLKVFFASCRMDRNIPLEGRYAKSSIAISKSSIDLQSVSDGSNGGFDETGYDTLTFVNTTNSNITIESIYLGSDTVFTIMQGRVSSAVSLSPGEKHEVIIRYFPFGSRLNDYDNHHYDTLHIKILGEPDRFVPIKGTFFALDVDETASASPEFSINITPNPATENVIVSMNGTYTKRVFLRLYDAIGREMTACATELDNTAGVLIPNITALPIGTYRLVATTAAGIVLSTKLLLIQR
ncbi:MAG: hypothetical protein U0264_15230 [Candidatus Kapaibacterium sp.]